MTTAQVRAALAGTVDTVSVKNGVFTVRRGFFYRHGNDAEKIGEAIRSAIPSAVILEGGEVWKDFRGGASVANQSHWWVKFRA